MFQHEKTHTATGQVSLVSFGEFEQYYKVDQPRRILLEFKMYSTFKKVKKESLSAKGRDTMAVLPTKLQKTTTNKYNIR